MNIYILGIDIAKNVFQLHGADEQGDQVMTKRLTRNNLVKFIAQLPNCIIAMEACASANYWARKFQSLGHQVKLISAQFVKPYVKTNKNDRNDAQAIAEAASRPHMHFVPIKTIEQQDIQNLHRVRERLIQNRTGLLNQIRGLLSEYGIIIPQGSHHVRKQLPLILEDAENELSVLTRELFATLYEQLVILDKQLVELNKHIEIICSSNHACQKLIQIEGVGPLIATALVAAIGDATTFKNGRHVAAWLGLVPKQYSSGNKIRLSGISKRGNSYLRTLLIHGGRSVVLRCAYKQDKRSLWLVDKKTRCGSNKAAVALANKNARIAWALLAKNEDYRRAA